MTRTEQPWWRAPVDPPAGKAHIQGMTTITFDTLKFVHRLRSAGIPEPQAEAITEAFKDASGEAEVATRRDVERLEAKIDALEYRMTIKLGGMLVVAVGVIAVLVKLL